MRLPRGPRRERAIAPRPIGGAALGNVPLDRIVFNPLPGTATEKDVVLLDDHEDRLCELIDGTLLQKTMGFEESLIAMRIAQLLLNFVMPRKLGIVSGPDGMMRMIPERIRIPDVAFVGFNRLPGGKLTGAPATPTTLRNHPQFNSQRASN